MAEDLDKLGFQVVEPDLGFFDLRSTSVSAVDRFECRVYWDWKLFVFRHCLLIDLITMIELERERRAEDLVSYELVPPIL